MFKELANNNKLKWEHFISKSGHHIGDIQLRKINDNKFIVSAVVVENMSNGVQRIAMPERYLQRGSRKDALYSYKMIRNEMSKYK